MGRIVTIDQLDFYTSDVTTPTTNNIPLLGQSPPLYQSIGVAMLKVSALMGVFFLTPSSIEQKTINMISSFNIDPKGKKVVETSSLSPHEAVYDAIQSISDFLTGDLHLVASNPYHLPYWLEPSLFIIDYLLHTFPSNKCIIEIMSTNELVWEDHHHRSSFLPNTSSVDHDFASPFTTDIVKTPQTPILLQNIDSEGNLCNITQTNPIDISTKLGTLEHVHVG